MVPIGDPIPLAAAIGRILDDEYLAQTRHAPCARGGFCASRSEHNWRYCLEACRESSATITLLSEHAANLGHHLLAQSTLTYFGRVLESLRAQTLATDQWELLLVDNASDSPLADSWDLSWHPHHLKLREEEQGLTPARLRGIKESEGQLIVFVDDDNLLASNYLERALEVEREYPFVSVFGAGALTPEFEVEPRPHVGHLCPLLGLRTVSRVRWTNNPKDSPCIPWGAGLCAKRATAMAYDSSRRANGDRARAGSARAALVLRRRRFVLLGICASRAGFRSLPESADHAPGAR